MTMDNLEKCIWRITWEMNEKGIGSTFDITDKEVKCQYCTGYHKQFKCYVPDTSAYPLDHKSFDDGI